MIQRIAFIVLCLLLCLPSVAQAGGRDYFVSPDGDKDSSGASPSQPFRSIQQALQLAQPGDTIHLGPGHYYQDASPSAMARRASQSPSPARKTRACGSAGIWWMAFSMASRTRFTAISSMATRLAASRFWSAAKGGSATTCFGIMPLAMSLARRPRIMIRPRPAIRLNKRLGAARKCVPVSPRCAGRLRALSRRNRQSALHPGATRGRRR